MRTTLPENLEQGRLRTGPFGSSAEEDGVAGVFIIQGPKGYPLMRIMSSGPDDEFKWEHVSVSVERRPPNWAEMCFVKDLFWGEEECVVQYHPPRSDYVNVHPNCLHLWKPMGVEIPRPPKILVG